MCIRDRDQVNLQYSLFISQTKFEENRIIQTISENSKKDRTDRFFGMVGACLLYTSFFRKKESIAKKRKRVG